LRHTRHAPAPDLEATTLASSNRSTAYRPGLCCRRAVPSRLGPLFGAGSPTITQTTRPQPFPPVLQALSGAHAPAGTGTVATKSALPSTIPPTSTPAPLSLLVTIKEQWRKRRRGVIHQRGSAGGTVLRRGSGAVMNSGPAFRTPAPLGNDSDAATATIMAGPSDGSCRCYFFGGHNGRAHGSTGGRSASRIERAKGKPTPWRESSRPLPRPATARTGSRRHQANSTGCRIERQQPAASAPVSGLPARACSEGRSWQVTPPLHPASSALAAGPSLKIPGCAAIAGRGPGVLEPPARRNPQKQPETRPTTRKVCSNQNGSAYALGAHRPTKGDGRDQQKACEAIEGKAAYGPGAASSQP